MSKKLLGHLTRFTSGEGKYFFIDTSKVIAVRPMYEDDAKEPYSYKIYLNDDHEDDRFEAILNDDDLKALGIDLLP